MKGNRKLSTVANTNTLPAHETHYQGVRKNQIHSLFHPATWTVENTMTRKKPEYCFKSNNLYDELSTLHDKGYQILLH
jgi:hypothetical protein